MFESDDPVERAVNLLAPFYGDKAREFSPGDVDVPSHGEYEYDGKTTRGAVLGHPWQHRVPAGGDGDLRGGVFGDGPIETFAFEPTEPWRVLLRAALDQAPSQAAVFEELAFNDAVHPAVAELAELGRMLRALGFLRDPAPSSGMSSVERVAVSSSSESLAELLSRLIQHHEYSVKRSSGLLLDYNKSFRELWQIYRALKINAWPPHEAALAKIATAGFGDPEPTT